MANGVVLKGSDEEAYLATTLSQIANPGLDIEITWDGMWIVRVGGYHFVHEGRLHVADWHTMGQLAERQVRLTRDHWFHVYEPRIGDVIIDIGAGRGEDELCFSEAVGLPGQVWAIEPHPRSLEVLAKFCTFNKLSNVRMLPFACGDKQESLWIESREDWVANSTSEHRRSLTDLPVEGVAFDDLAADLGIDRIDLLVMNIEGGERSALGGCERSLQRARFVSVAAHDFRADRGEEARFRTFDFVCDVLLKAGFRITTRREDSRPWVACHVHGSRL